MSESPGVLSTGGENRGIPGEAARAWDSAFGAHPAVFASAVAMAVLSGLVLRWYHLGGQSLWFDEGLTAFGASLSSGKIIRYAQSSDFPPLYYLLEHYWTNLFGNSEAALRSLSALAGTLSLPLFYALSKRLMRNGAAVLLATWLFAFSAMQVWFSREARTYALASLLGLVSLHALVRLADRPSRPWFALLVLSLAVSMYLHNMLFFYLLALNLAWFVYPSERTWTERSKEILFADVIAAALYLPWVPSLLHQVQAVVGKGWWGTRPTIRDLFDTLSTVCGFSFGYLDAVAHRVLPALSDPVLWSVLLAGAGLLCALLLAGGLWVAPSLEKRKVLSLLLYGFIPPLAVFAFSWVGTPLFEPRLFLNSSIIAPLVFAYPLAVQRQRKARLLYGFLGGLLSVAASLSAVGSLRYEQKEDWRGTTAWLLRIPRQNRLMVFVSRTGEMFFDHYAAKLPHAAPPVAKMGLPIGYSAQFPPSPIKAIASMEDIRPLVLAVESQKYSEIDLVLAHERLNDPRDLVSHYLSQAFACQQEQRFYGIRVVRFSAVPLVENSPALGALGPDTSFDEGARSRLRSLPYPVSQGRTSFLATLSW